MIEKFHFGTSSWSEKSWDGVFYPSGIRPADRIQYYATQFETVEADVTYYRIPTMAMVQNWKRKTPETFIFSAKFPRSIVHAGDGRTPDPEKLLLKDHVGDDTTRFLEMMQVLGPRMGPLVMQFPYFNKKVFENATAFYDRLTDFFTWLPEGFQYAVEIRNKNYLKPELFDLLREHSIPMVFVDLLYMPGPRQLAKMDIRNSGSFHYIRLIGDRKAVEKKADGFDKIVVDKSGALDEWSEFLAHSADGVNEIFAYANNHYAGHGPATIRELQQKIEAGLAG